MIAETATPRFGSTGLDWVTVALAAQRNVRRIFGSRCDIVGAAGLNEIRRVLGTDDWFAAIAAAASVVVDPDPNPLDLDPFWVRAEHRLWHQGKPYEQRGREWLDFSGRVQLWPNGRPDRLSRGAW